MSGHRQASRAAIAWQPFPLWRTLRTLATLAIAAAAAGCWTAPVASLAGADPSDPSARAPAVGYRSTIEPYASLRPVAPAPWRQRNEQVAPKAKQ
jgi:hypothetical protein